MPRVAILASGDVKTGGGGSTAEQVARDALEGKVAFSIGVVICNNPAGSVGVYDHFDNLNREFSLLGDNKIEVVNISSGTHPKGPQPRGQTLGESEAICRLLEDRAIDFVTMLGYMKVLNGEFVETWGWQKDYAQDPIYGHSLGIYHPNARILNNHPAILPFTADTYGSRAHQRAVDLYKQGKLRHTAMTWHLASAEVDQGPTIDEKSVPISDNDNADTLGQKVQKVEKEHTAKVIGEHLIFRAEHLRANS